MNSRLARIAPLLAMVCSSWIGTSMAGGGTSAACANPAGGYEGFGRNTTGGAGQPVYRVTNLNDSGSGSLRDAISQGNRCVVFDVAGTISLSSALLARGANITIDGFTAPSPGITLTRWGFDWHGPNRGVANIIARGLRIRGTVGPESAGADGFQIVGVPNFVIDHVSIDQWGDGSIDITGENGIPSRDFTIQWSIFGKGRDKKDKSLLIGYTARRGTLHHNLFINANDRSPLCDWSPDLALKPARDEIVCDFRNNLVWGYGWTGTSVRRNGTANVVNNFYYSAGNTNPHSALYIVEAGIAYASGNASLNRMNIDAKGNRATPFPAIVPTTTDALTAARQILAQAGARGPRFDLDSTDLNLIGQILPLLAP
jgi:large repetitive protein